MPSPEPTQPDRPRVPDDRDSSQEPQLARLSSLLRAATEAGALLAQINDETEIYEAVCRFAVTGIHCDIAWIGLSEPGTRAIRVQTAFGEPRAFLDDARLTVGSTLGSHASIRTALASRASVIVPDLSASADECRPAGGRHGLRSMAVVPMHARRLVIGVLVCYSAAAEAYGSDEIAILEALVGQAMTRLAAIDKDRHRREAQKALAKTEERYRLLFEAAPLGVMVIGPVGVEVNDSLLAMFGYADRDEFGGRYLEDLVPDDCRDDIAAFHDSLVGEDRTPAIIRTRGLRADGTSFPLLVDGTQVAVGDGDNAVYFLTDLEPMETAESLARTARSQYRQLVEAAPLPVVSMSVDGIVQSWNPAAERLFGWSASETLGRLVPGGLSDRDRRYFRAVADGDGRGAAPHETRVRARDGRPLDLRVRASQVHDTDGRLAGLLLIAEDVTTERQLAIERARLATAIEQTAESIVISDLKGNIVYVNPAFEATTGYSRAEALGRNPRILKSGEQSPAFYDHMWTVLTSGQTWSGQFINRRKDGTEFVEEATISPIRGGNGAVSGYVAVKRDVTEVRAQQVALAATERSYKFLFENMQEGLAYHRMIWEQGVPVDYEFLGANEMFAELTGLKDVIGKRASDVIPGLRDSDPELFDVYGRVAAGGPPEKIRTHVAALDMWFSVSVYCPEPGTFATIFENVTEQEKAAEALRTSEEIYRTILENAPFAIGAHRDGRGLFANEAHRKMFGYSDPNDLQKLGPADMVAEESLEAVADMIRRRKAGERLGPEYEILGRRQDGSTFPMLVRYADIALADGPASILFHLDLTEIRQAQEAVRQSEEKFASAFRHSPVVVYITDLATEQLVDVNDEGLRLSGYTLEELVGKRAVDVGWVTAENEAALIAEVREKGRIVGKEVRRTAKGGHVVEALIYVERITIAGRECMLTSSIDITERNQLARNLAEARALQVAVSDSTADWIFSVDADEFALTSFNRAFADQAARVFGLKLEPGMRPDQMDRDPQRRNVWVKFFERAVSSGSFEVEYAAGLGLTLSVTFNRIVRDGEIIGVSVFGRDITEARRAQDELRESEERFRAVSEHSLSGIAIADGETFRYVNPAFAQIAGRTPDELIGGKVLDLIFPDDRAAVAEGMRRRLSGEADTVTYQARIVRRDGHVRRLLIFGSKVEMGGQRLILTNALDITETSQAEEALRVSEARFRAVSENSLSGIAIVDRGRLAYVNRAYATIFGYEPEELIGRELMDLIAPASQAQAAEAMRAAGDTVDSSVTLEAMGLRKDGTTNTVIVMAAYAEFEGRRVGISNVLDITERKRLEDDLRQSQKLEALGRLAGGVAHDFNNLLTAIGGYARLLKDDLAVGSTDPEYPVRIIEAADRASAMTSRLLAFSGRQTKRRVPVVLTDSVKGILPILKRVVPERIEIATDLRLVPTVLGDSTEVDQILLNLVVNASDAISGAGRIRIETSLVVHDDEFVRINDHAAPGPHVRLTVSDTGSGMDEATMARMYEPFFTTKPKGSGTGLGLAMVYGIVEGMEGSIDVTSAPGAGTTFRIDLPVSGEVPEVEHAFFAGPTSGNERILLVEDEPNVLILSERILRRLGYRVTAVGSPREALELPAIDFDLVVTDVVMPGMDGPELVRQLRETNPAMPALYVSGYQPKAEMTAALHEPRTSLLPKPFTVAGVAQAVRGALEDAAEPHGANDR